jgi:hypothetical protein
MEERQRVTGIVCFRLVQRQLRATILPEALLGVEQHKH